MKSSTPVIGSATPVAPGVSGVARAWEHIPLSDDQSELMTLEAQKGFQQGKTLVKSYKLATFI